MGFINTIVSLLCAPVVVPIYRQMNYMFLAGANMKALKKVTDELKLAKDLIEQRIAAAIATND